MTTHSGHKEGSEGAVCINCHMPKTEFGRMIRSDHSFRPPTPETTIKYGSPNACNICHMDETPEWANEIVKKRKNANYQDETLEWASRLIESEYFTKLTRFSHFKTVQNFVYFKHPVFSNNSNRRFKYLFCTFTF